eukprot:6164333-Amphidinium_carterae.1
MEGSMSELCISDRARELLTCLNQEVLHNCSGSERHEHDGMELWVSLDGVAHFQEQKNLGMTNHGIYSWTM